MIVGRAHVDTVVTFHDYNRHLTADFQLSLIQHNSEIQPWIPLHFGKVVYIAIPSQLKV